MAVMECVSRSLEGITKDRKRLNKKLLETKKEILKIRFSRNFKLNEEDKKSYDSWNKDILENKKKSVIILKPYKNEKDYAIRQIKSSISYNQMALTSLICEEKGHKEKSSHTCSGAGGTRVYATCGRCGMSYFRGLTSKESDSWNKMMNTPFTI